MVDKLKTRSNAFAAVLAGGSGTRMGNPDKPKQYLLLGGKPVLVHTLEKIAVSADFDCVLVLCPAEWVQQTRDIVEAQCGALGSEIVVLAGGATRNDTVANAIAFIEERFEVDDETILLTHDAVRPFVTVRMVQENIASAREFGAADTVIPATDTIVESLDGNSISSIPDRRTLYQGQTPQTFNLRRLAAHMASLTPEERETLTDACKIFVLRGDRVALVRGDSSNMKITFPQDMRLAESLLGEQRC